MATDSGNIGTLPERPPKKSKGKKSKSRYQIYRNGKFLIGFTSKKDCRDFLKALPIREKKSCEIMKRI